ncbi:MAG: AraC family transcriptional regulator [Micromonosporaceae bacterium]|nr:AraC family transcriptional regulator [Micromonosporaceae bacterium]
MSENREHRRTGHGSIDLVELDFERCYRAVDSRDARFDGWFVTAVTSTHIYCRPSCPAITPKRRNVRFLPTPAAAQREGFRACLRCRPDAAPGSPEWDNRADVVARAVRLIGDGIVDRAGVPGLAGRLGYTERHLGRMLHAELGAGPLALARAQRAQTARVLVETTAMGLAEVAFAAGFRSVRQFNETMRDVYGRAPSDLRRASSADRVSAPGTITLRLPYRSPLHAASLFGFLAARAIPGVEHVDADGYHRTLRLPHGPGTASLTAGNGTAGGGTPGGRAAGNGTAGGRTTGDGTAGDGTTGDGTTGDGTAGGGYVRATLRLTDVRDLAPAVARCRRLLDLDADPQAVDAALAADPALAADVAAAPGVRLPRAVDGFELAVRAIVGQQVSVAAARTVLAKLAQATSTAGPSPVPDKNLSLLFPDAAAVAAAPDDAFGMPAARRRTIRALAAAVAGGDLLLDDGADRTETARKLRELPGVGPWTAGYTALRALGDPDVFLPTDLGVRRGAVALGLPDAIAALTDRAAAWRPWRSYALIRLWRHA